VIGRVWRQHYYRVNADLTKLTGHTGLNTPEIPEISIDFTKLSSISDIVESAQLSEPDDNKYAWAVSTLRLLFACSTEEERSWWINYVQEILTKYLNKKDKRDNKSEENLEKRSFAIFSSQNPILDYILSGRAMHWANLSQPTPTRRITKAHKLPTQIPLTNEKGPEEVAVSRTCILSSTMKKIKVLSDLSLPFSATLNLYDDTLIYEMEYEFNHNQGIIPLESCWLRDFPSEGNLISLIKL
jgi:hypothetical protein